MAAPLVSLLIPTYNSALTVADAIASCRNQTWGDLEIVIYDEVSKDQTREIIFAAAKEDPRIRVLTSETNSGPVRAWRKLLHEARGKYCTFVWSDDLILPRYVEALLGLFRQNPAQLLAVCNAYSELLPETVQHEGSSKNLVTGEKSRGLLHDFPSGKVKGDVYALGILTAVYPVSQICALFETTAAREVFDHYIDFENPYGFDFSRRAYGNDVSFLSELGLRSGELLVLGEPLVACRASPDSMTVNARRDHRWQYWLQYVWAIRAAWTRCRPLSPRMDALIRVADDRVSFCEFFYAMKNKRFPKEFNPAKIARALWFLYREDRRLNPKVGPATLEKWLAN
ncbi:MAG TPA: glycosyltransferase [Candidatus Saccharimonadales bacterium]|nr:glycosyltransferase [Candidatus Saccharimonadales bacterium]